LFVRDVYADGGEAGVDAAFAHPPVDTAQLLEPALYLHHVGPVHVAAPSVAGHIARRGTLGALGVSVVLTHGGLDLGRSEYLRGWAGDAYVVDHEHGASCLHDALRLRTAAFARTALARFGQWAKAESGRSVARIDADTIGIVSCHR
jgi:hypothetical protein